MFMNKRAPPKEPHCGTYLDSRCGIYLRANRVGRLRAVSFLVFMGVLVNARPVRHAAAEGDSTIPCRQGRRTAP